MLGRGFAIGVGFVILDNEIEKRAIICMLVLGSLRGLESWCKLVLGMRMIIMELDQEDVVWAHLMALAALTWGGCLCWLVL